MILDFLDSAVGVVRWVLLLIDSVGLTFIDEAYNLMISTITAFNGDKIADIAKDITKNCYIIVGVFALFRMAFVLINSIITPEKLNEKSTNPGSLITKLIITVSLFVVVPLIFSESRKLQNTIINNNYISKLIIGIDLTKSNENATDTSTTETDGKNEENVNDVGKYIKDIAVRALIHPDDKLADKESQNKYNPNSECNDECSDAVNSWNNDASYSVLSTHIAEYVEINDEAVYVYKYTPFVTLAVGLFITYVLFSFAIDIAMRSVELAVLEIIAPLFIVTYIDPKSATSGPFKKWMDTTVKTFISLFIKIAIISLMILFIAKFSELYDTATDSSGFLQLIILIAILMFCKKAPKWLGNMLGTEAGIGQLGIGKKLKEGLPMGDKAAKLGRAGTGMAVGAAKALGRANKTRRKNNKSALAEKGIGYSQKARDNRHPLMQNELIKKGLDPNKKYSDLSRKEKAKYQQAEADYISKNRKDAEKAIKKERKDAGETWKNTALKGVAAAVGGAAAGAQAGYKADKLTGALTGSLKAANQFADSKDMAKHNTLSDRIRNSNVGRRVAGIPGILDNAFGDKYEIADAQDKLAKNKKAFEFTNHQATGAGVGEGKVPVSTGQFLGLYANYKDCMKGKEDIGLATYASYGGYESFRRDGDNVIFTKSDGTQKTISKDEFEKGKVSNLINTNSSYIAEAEKAYATFQEQSLTNYERNSNELSRVETTYREATQQRSNVEREIQQIQSGSRTIASNIQALCPQGIGITIDATSVDSMKATFGDSTIQAMGDYKKIQSELNTELLVDVNGMTDEQKQEHYSKITKLQNDLQETSKNIKIGDTKIEKVDEIISLVDQFMTIKPEEEAKLNIKNAELAELNSQISTSGKYINDLRTANSQLQIIYDNIGEKDDNGNSKAITMADKMQAVAKDKSDAEKKVAAYEAKKKDN